MGVLSVRRGGSVGRRYEKWYRRRRIVQQDVGKRRSKRVGPGEKG